MENQIVIYETDQEALSFLQGFFKKHRQFHAEFSDSIASLLRSLSSEEPCPPICIAPARALGQLGSLPDDSSVIAVITGDYETGVRAATRYGADHYLVSPLNDHDLAFKIQCILDKRSLFATLRREASDFQTIIELTHLVSSTLDPQEILYLIVKKIAEVIPVTRCSIVRVTGNKRFAHVVSTFEDPTMRNIKLDLGRYPEIRHALGSKQTVIISDAKTDPLMEQVRDLIFPLNISSIVVIPIIFHEEVIGTLFLRTSRSQTAFTEHEITLCNAIANVSANALYNAFLFEKIEGEKEKLERLAITDFLTGVYNIRYFYHRLEEEFSRSARYHLPLSCLMFDIDHFKLINDRHGHRVGDMVLREFAQLLRRHTRKSDVLSRYGGEEFIMLLPQTPPDGALAKAEEFRSCVETHQFRGLEERKGPTVSIGIATYPNPAIKDKEDLITMADNALYKAKVAGRNRVVVSPLEP